MSSDFTKFILRPSKADKISICFKARRGKVECFTIQYRSKINESWRTVIRYDTSHGYAHKHTYSYKKKRKIRTITLSGNYGSIFTHSYNEIIDKMKRGRIKENFMFQ